MVVICTCPPGWYEDGYYNKNCPLHGERLETVTTYTTTSTAPDEMLWIFVNYPEPVKVKCL